MKKKTPEEYFSSLQFWENGVHALRKIILDTGLDEAIKWGTPVYSFQGKNILGIGAFKSYLGIWFYQGALLKDDQKVLINAQEGKTNALRQWRFTSIGEIDAGLIKDYITEAIQNQIEGKVIKPNRKKPLIVPKELLDEFDKSEKLRQRFEELTLARRREFVDFLNEAKRDSTKRIRLIKIIPLINDGKGLHDKYKK